MNDIIEKLNRNIIALENLEDSKISIKDKIGSLNKRIHIISVNIKDLTTAYEYYKKGVDIIYQQTVKSLENQLTNLLQEVFNGCNYGVVFDIEDLRGSKNLILELVDDNFQGDPEDFGGSLTTVVGYLFQLMYLIKSGRPKILLMDELFRDVNDDYLSNLIELINRVTLETDSINILITQVQELQCLVKNTYTVQDGKYELKTSQI